MTLLCAMRDQSHNVGKSIAVGPKMGAAEFPGARDFLPVLDTPPQQYIDSLGHPYGWKPSSMRQEAVVMEMAKRKDHGWMIKAPGRCQPSRIK